MRKCDCLEAQCIGVFVVLIDDAFPRALCRQPLIGAFTTKMAAGREHCFSSCALTRGCMSFRLDRNF